MFILLSVLSTVWVYACIPICVMPVVAKRGSWIRWTGMVGTVNLLPGAGETPRGSAGAAHALLFFFFPINGSLAYYFKTLSWITYVVFINLFIFFFCDFF